jgi:hypothetical protein
MLIHNVFEFFCYMKIRYDFCTLRDLAICMKIRYFLLFFHIIIFATFRRKSSILIPDLYLYNIKIQTTIKQN